MTIGIANAPCSWGVEFATDPRNPSWERVLNECAASGYRGIELGPVGFMPEDPAVLGSELEARELTLVGGVVFRPFHDPGAWDELLDAARRTCIALSAHGAEYLVLIDSISPRRSPSAGRADEAEQMSIAEWKGFVERIRHVARVGREDYGLTPCIHAHAAGFVDFEPELERLLDEIDPATLRICFDTGHHSYAGYDPVAFMRRHMDRITYIHFKDIDPVVKRWAVESRADFYEACARGIFCNLGKGDVDFAAVKALLAEAGYSGWCTVEQDCDPQGATVPLEDARANRAFLRRFDFQ